MPSCQCSHNVAGDTGQRGNATTAAVPLQQRCPQIPLHMEPVPAGRSIPVQLGVGRLLGLMQNWPPGWVAALPQKCRTCHPRPVLGVGSGLTAARPADTAAQPRFTDRPLPKCPYTSLPTGEKPAGLTRAFLSLVHFCCGCFFCLFPLGVSLFLLLNKQEPCLFCWMITS